MHSGISRRRLLRGVAALAGLAGVGAAAGCDLFGSAAPDNEELPPELTQQLDETVALGDAYDGAIARVPALADRLTALRDAHRAHAQALAQAMGQPTPPAGTAGTATNEAEVLAELADAETRGVESARAACLAAPSRFASLLGSIAAARACHLEVLT